MTKKRANGLVLFSKTLMSETVFPAAAAAAALLVLARSQFRNEIKPL